MVQLCRRIADDRRFQLIVLGVIVFNAALMGVETSARLTHEYGSLLSALNLAIQGFFVFEMTVRLLSYWPRLPLFFRDGWNLFDFSIVTLSLLPVAGPFATVSRLARLLRVTRLVSVSTELRLIIGTMVRSIPSMGHVALLLGVLVYVYAIVGFYLFRSHDPENWSDLKSAMLTVFQMLCRPLSCPPCRGRGLISPVSSWSASSSSSTCSSPSSSTTWRPSRRKSVT
jgi:voltage-gated sodium channel